MKYLQVLLRFFRWRYCQRTFLYASIQAVQFFDREVFTVVDSSGEVHELLQGHLFCDLWVMQRSLKHHQQVRQRVCGRRGFINSSRIIMNVFPRKDLDDSVDFLSFTGKVEERQKVFHSFVDRGFLETDQISERFEDLEGMKRFYYPHQEPMNCLLRYWIELLLRSNRQVSLSTGYHGISLRTELLPSDYA